MGFDGPIYGLGHEFEAIGGPERWWEMQSFAVIFHHLGRGGPRVANSLKLAPVAPAGVRTFGFSSDSTNDHGGDDSELKDFLDYMDDLKNYERTAMPRGGGTDTDDGLDLGRMRRLMECLGNPHFKFKAVHIAGTKGKGSTSAFLSNILREEGYSVGCYTSPHLCSIRERISLGKVGNAVSATTLKNHFYQVKDFLDQAIKQENGALSHFEVLTGLAFSLFAHEKIDIAVIEAGLGGARDATNVLRGTELAASVITNIDVEHLAALGGSLESIAMAKSGIIKHGRPLVMGGPFKPHIEHILRQKASSMNSPVISACDPGIRSIVKDFKRSLNKPCQCCDIHIEVEKDLRLCIELVDVKLRMLGDQQIQNAITATCSALCLHDQGWRVSDKSIHAGLEQTYLLGRGQFLTNKEIELVGLTGVSVLIDGGLPDTNYFSAHTEASAKGLVDIIKKAYPDGALALVVAMASDKNHVAFARQLLLGRQPDVVLLTEVKIAGGKTRMTSASSLEEAWVQAALELGIDFSDISMGDHREFVKHESDCRTGLIADCQERSITDSMKVAHKLIKERAEDETGLIVVTGSLHIVASVLKSLKR
ncbi:hypothetical protein ACLOJK_014455 [Asimina triloba]